MPKFSKIHYDKISTTIAMKIILPGTKKNSESDFVIEQLIQMFEDDNPRFNRKEFEYACGYR